MKQHETYQKKCYLNKRAEVIIKATKNICNKAAAKSYKMKSRKEGQGIGKTSKCVKDIWKI